MSKPACLCAFLILLGIGSAALADKPRFGDTLTISVGGMNHRGKARFSSTRSDATVDRLTFKDLGFSDSADVFWGDLSWQFAERWQFRLNYSSFDADGFKAQTRSGNFGDLDWSVGASLTSSFDMKLYIAEVTWDVLKTPKGHFGLGLGLHAADLDLDLALGLSGQIGGVGGSTEVRREEASVLAPLPNLSLEGGYLLADKLYLSGRVGYFSLSYDKYDGRLFSARGAVEWRPWRHVGLGLAYQFVDMNLDVDRSDRDDSYHLEFYGPVIFVAAGF